MKIVFISHMYPSPIDEVHGIFVHKQVLELIAQGCEVKVVKPVPWAPFPLTLLNNKWRRYAKLKHEAIIDGVEVFYPKYIALPKKIFFHYSGYLMYFCIKKLVRDIYNIFKFDLIHSHVALPDGYAGMLIKEKVFAKPLVVTIHGQDLQQTIYKNKNCFESMEKVFKKADAIITVSSKLKRIAENSFGVPQKITVINNGVDFEKAFCINARNDKTGNLNKLGDIIILSVSNLIKSKGVDLNIIAISRIINKYPTIKYLVIGDGPEEKHLKELALKLGINNRLEFLGKLPHKDVFKYMAMADIFSLPSFKEGFGVVYLEAMCCGKPVIACQGEGIEDVIEHGKTGLLVKPNNVEDLAEKLEMLIYATDKAKIIGRRAKDLVLNNYTWRNNVKKTIQVYKKVLKNEKV